MAKKKKLKLKYSRIFALLIVFASICCLVFIGAKSFSKFFNKKSSAEDNTVVEKTPEPEKPVVNKASLVMVGDSLIHGAVYYDARVGNDGYDFKPMLSNLKEFISSFDLAFYNQESILGGTEIGLSTYPCFNSPYEVGDAFRDLGFNIVSLANNHTLDRGEKAIINSKNYWNQFDDIMTAGSYSSQEDRDNIKIQEKNGIKYVLLSYTDTTNGIRIPTGKDYLVNKYSEEMVKADIEKVRDKVDVLMVAMHFGEEYVFTPNARQKEIAKFLADNGVDIVIGHHPHVVEPIEFIDDTMVIYSLGNFISAQRGVEKLTGLIASIDIVKTTYQGETTIKLENPRADLVYTDSKTASNGGRYNFKLYLYKDLNNSILPNYESYREKYLNIVTGGNPDIYTGGNYGDKQ